MKKQVVVMVLMIVLMIAYAACTGSQYIRQSTGDSVRVKSGKMHVADSTVH
ncbi:hypothetical protein QTN47_16475 [Danxiaibacter flavus]|uniref:Lysis protein n=1 Tax=Danxiaibacter flavus TaxID=3049108 RepID=A0ABV3ZGS9_9BACT|nr:hypothetical protein QNM32_16485 [Chitinophagaceae bacterium DXS]